MQVIPLRLPANIFKTIASASSTTSSCYMKLYFLFILIKERPQKGIKTRKVSPVVALRWPAKLNIFKHTSTATTSATNDSFKSKHHLQFTAT